MLPRARILTVIVHGGGEVEPRAAAPTACVRVTPTTAGRDESVPDRVTLITHDERRPQARSDHGVFIK